MIGPRMLAAMLVVASSLHSAFGHPIIKREGADETVEGFGLTDIIVVEGLGFSYQELTFRTQDLSPDAGLDAKAIADDFQNFTAVELANVASLQVTDVIVDLEQYSTVLAEYQLAVLEKAFLHELIRHEDIFNLYREPVRNGIKQQLEVLDIFGKISKVFAPKLATGLDPITNSRAAYLKKVLTVFA